MCGIKKINIDELFDLLKKTNEKVEEEMNRSHEFRGYPKGCKIGRGESSKSYSFLETHLQTFNRLLRAGEYVAAGCERCANNQIFEKDKKHVCDICILEDIGLSGPVKIEINCKVKSSEETENENEIVNFEIQKFHKKNNGKNGFENFEIKDEEEVQPRKCSAWRPLKGEKKENPYDGWICKICQETKPVESFRLNKYRCGQPCIKCRYKQERKPDLSKLREGDFVICIYDDGTKKSGFVEKDNEWNFSVNQFSDFSGESIASSVEEIKEIIRINIDKAVSAGISIHSPLNAYVFEEI